MAESSLALNDFGQIPSSSSIPSHLHIPGVNTLLPLTGSSSQKYTQISPLKHGRVPSLSLLEDVVSYCFQKNFQTNMGFKALPNFLFHTPSHEPGSLSSPSPMPFPPLGTPIPIIFLIPFKAQRKQPVPPARINLSLLDLPSQQPLSLF